MKIATNIKTLAALLMAGAAFTACSSSSDEIIDKQPENPTAPKVYTMVIKASKGGDATTRALSTDGTGIKAYWDGTETFEVVQYNSSSEPEIIGTATAAASPNGNTTITATMNQPPSIEYFISFYLHGTACDYTGQKGLLTGSNSISKDYDYAYGCLEASDFTVSGYDVIPNDGVTLDITSSQAIVKFTLVDKGNDDEAINAKSLNIHDENGVLIKSTNGLTSAEEYGDINITPAGTTNVIYAALLSYIFEPEMNLTLTANDGNNVYTYSKSNVTFTCGMYYPITVKMNKILARVNMTTAEAVLGGGYTAISAEQAAALAKQCWTVAGGTVYVVYNIAGTPIPSIYYVKTDDGESTTSSSISAMQASNLYTGTSTAWFVEPPAFGFSKQLWTDSPISAPGTFKSVSQAEAKTAADAEKTATSATGYVCIYAREGGKYKWIDSHGRTGQDTSIDQIVNEGAWAEVYECQSAGDDYCIWFTVEN